MDAAKTIETTIAGVLKPRGYRKRARNWFRTTSANEYQVVNLQKSPWGGGSCYLNVGWDPGVAAGEFLAEYNCALSLRAEDTDVIPTIERVRADGVTVLEWPGITLLDARFSKGTPADAFEEQLSEIIVLPLADFLDGTPSIVDLVPLLTAKPWLAMLSLREELERRGHKLPRHVVTR